MHRLAYCVKEAADRAEDGSYDLNEKGQERCSAPGRKGSRRCINRRGV